MIPDVPDGSARCYLNGVDQFIVSWGKRASIDINVTAGIFITTPILCYPQVAGKAQGAGFDLSSRNRNNRCLPQDQPHLHKEVGDL